MSKREDVQRLRGEGLTYRAIGERLGISTARAHQLGREACRPANPLGVSTLTWNSLARSGYADPGRLASVTADELLAIPNFGFVALSEVAAALGRPDLKRSASYCERVSHYAYRGVGR